MTSIDYDFFLREGYVPTLDQNDDSGIVNDFILKMRSLDDPNFDDVVLLMAEIDCILERETLYLHHFKCIYHELQAVVNKLNRCSTTETCEDKLAWLKFFMELTNAVNFRDYTELWQTAAFLLLEEALDACGDNVNIGDYFNLLIHFNCFSESLVIDLSEVLKLEFRYRSAVLKIFLSFIAQTKHKACAFSSFPYNLAKGGECMQADDFVVSLCKEALVSNMNAYPVFRIIKQFQMTGSIIPDVVKCLCSKMDREIAVPSEVQMYVLGLIVYMYSPTFWKTRLCKKNE